MYSASYYYISLDKQIKPRQNLVLEDRPLVKIQGIDVMETNSNIETSDNQELEK